MSTQAMHSLLLREIKTWQQRKIKIIIDLILITLKLAAAMTRCKIYETEYESDHWVIITAFNMILSS